MGADFVANDYDVGDVFTITLETGETLEDAEVVGKDHDPGVDTYDRSWTSLTLEGGWWEQVNDRVDSEVLQLDQKTNRGSDEWQPATVLGHVWVGDPKEASEPEYEELGTVESVE